LVFGPANAGVGEALGATRSRRTLATEAAFANALKSAGMTLADFRERTSRSIRVNGVIQREVRSKVEVDDEWLQRTYRERLEKVLKIMLDEGEFLSPHGVRALSRVHESHPFEMPVNGDVHRVDYEPGESTSGLFGGNSNWRGPIWFPVNYLLIEALQKFHHYYGDDLKVEFPTGSGQMLNLWEVSQELSRRLSHIFLLDGEGKRPVFGKSDKMQNDPNFRDHLLFFEYFHGDNGRGVGASHQTGWTGLVAKLLHQSGE